MDSFIYLYERTRLNPEINQISLGRWHSIRTACAAITLRRLQRLGSEFFLVLVGQGLIALGGLVGVRLLTGAMPPAIYGEFALGTTIAALGQQTIFGPLAQAAVRYFGVAKERGNLSIYWHAIKRLAGHGNIVAGAITMAGVCVVTALGYGSGWIWLVISASVLSLIAGCSSIIEAIQIADRQRGAIALQNGMTYCLRPCFAVLIIAILGASSRIAMLGYVLASLLVFALQMVLFRRKTMHSGAATVASAVEAAQTSRQMLAYAWPFSAFGIMTFLQISSDRWALQGFHGTKSVGLYAAAFQLGYYPISLLINGVCLLITPVTFSRAGDGTDVPRLKSAVRLNQSVLGCGIVVTCVAAAFAYLFRSAVFRLLVAPEYSAASLYLPWLTLASGLFSCGQLAILTPMAVSATRALILPKIGTSLAGVTFNIIGAYWLGIWGVVLGNVAFAGLYLMWMLVLARQFVNKRLVAVNENRETSVLVP